MKPFLSAIMPAYNSEKAMGEAIDAIINQRYQNWELVIVDDGSKDKTYEIAQEYASKDKRIKVFQNNQNSGCPFTRNRAIEETTGEIIVIVDSDDISYPERFSKIAQVYKEDADLSVFYSNVNYFYTDTKKTERRFFQPFIKELLYHINFVPDPGASFKKKMYEELGGYDQNLRVGLDYDLWLRAATAGKKFGYTSEALVRYTKHPASLTANSDAKAAIAKRQEWNKKIRAKNKIFSVNPEFVKQNAEKDVIDFYVNKNFDIWFAPEAVPNN